MLKLLKRWNYLVPLEKLDPNKIRRCALYWIFTREKISPGLFFNKKSKKLLIICNVYAIIVVNM